MRYTFNLKYSYVKFYTKNLVILIKTILKKELKETEHILLAAS